MNCGTTIDSSGGLAGDLRARRRRRQVRSGLLGLVAASVIAATLAPIGGARVTAAPRVEADVVSLVPARLLETRGGAGNSTVDGRQQGGGRVAAGSVVAVQVAGRGGVPADATAVMLNVTAINPDRGGHATVFPCGGSVPKASNLNFAAGAVVPNAVLSKVGADGAVCVFSSAATDVVVDVNAAFTARTDAETPTTRQLVLAGGGAGVTGQSTAGDLPGNVEFVAGPLAGGADVGAPTARDIERELALEETEDLLGVRNESTVRSDRPTELLVNEPTFRIDQAYYTASPSSGVGRLMMWRIVNGQWQIASSCSGSVVARTMVLTAAHCLTDHTGTWWDGYTFVPGLAGSSTPAGTWSAAGNRAYRPTAYQQHENTAYGILFDYALVKFDPQHNQGRHLGDYTEQYTVYQGGADVTRKLSVGYPVEGFFDSGNGGYCARGQAWCWPYVCDSSDGRVADFGNNWRAMGYGCNSNGGSSGGGIFGQINGRWYIVSVVSQGGDLRDRNGNQCMDRQACNWYMRNTWGPEFKSGYFDTFYHEVAGL